MHTALRLGLLGAALLAAGGLAVPADADPIFSSASVSPDALSPNGDDVQDVAVITYQVVPDSADVVVHLAVPGGGVVGTLRVNTRQGRGIHSLLFDGTTTGGPVPDGNYEIRIFGSGTQGEGTESRTLPVTVDRAPPVISEWTLQVGAPSTVQDGDTVTLQACVNADADTVFIDLSGLDSEYDPAQVVETPLPPVCRLFTYTISPANSFADADQIPAVVQARDRAGNRSSATLFLCLSNFPPSVSQPAALLNEIPFFQNGDEIQVSVGFASPYPLVVTADLSNLDSLFDPDSVSVTSTGPGLYEVRYRIRAGNTRSDGVYPVRLSAQDPGCGEVEDATVTVTLDNAGENSALVEDFFASPNAFSPAGNGFKQTTLRFTTLVDSLTVIIATTAIYRNPIDTLTFAIRSPTIYNQGIHTVVWDGSFGPVYTPARLADQTLTVTLRAVSVQLDRQRSVFTSLEVDNVLPQLRGFPQPGQVSVRNGQIANLPVTYDRSGYALDADFRAADANFTPGSSTVVVADSTGGKYGIFYSMSQTNSVLDGTGIPVPVTATDRAGNIATESDLITVCLDNLPPRFLSAEFLEDPGPFRNGDHVLIATYWDTTETAQTNLSVSADFSAVDDRWHAVTRPATIITRGHGRYDVSYSISAQNGIPGGNDLPVYVTGRDAPGEGCGETEVVAIRLDLDSRGGTAPVFDSVAEVVREPLLPLSGQAAGSDSVEILLAGSPVDTFFVDPTTLRFQGSIVLASGDNLITARGFDLAGNVSPSSAPLHVYLAAGTLFTVPAAFYPGSEFFLVLEQPADALTLRIFSLEGIEIRRLESGGGDLYHVPWDGRDHFGSLTSSGACVVVAEVDRGGETQERLRKAFVFARHGGSP